MPDRMPEDMSDRMPEDMPDRMPEDLPDRMPEDMPEHMPDRMPNRMPEDMSDRMPQDLPVRKCINVMVGITRSKVIMFIWDLGSTLICQVLFPPVIAGIHGTGHFFRYCIPLSQAISEAEDGQHHPSGDTRSAGGSLVQGLGCKGLDEVHRPGVPESANKM